MDETGSLDSHFTHFNQNFKFNDFTEGSRSFPKEQNFLHLQMEKKILPNKIPRKNSNLQQHAFSFSPSMVL